MLQFTTNLITTLEVPTKDLDSYAIQKMLMGFKDPALQRHPMSFPTYAVWFAKHVLDPHYQFQGTRHEPDLLEGEDPDEILYEIRDVKRLYEWVPSDAPLELQRQHAQQHSERHARPSQQDMEVPSAGGGGGLAGLTAENIALQQRLLALGPRAGEAGEEANQIGAVQPPKPPPLPEGWQSHWSEKHNRPFYFHAPTEVSQWHMPQIGDAAPLQDATKPIGSELEIPPIDKRAACECNGIPECAFQ